MVDGGADRAVVGVMSSASSMSHEAERLLSLQAIVYRAIGDLANQDLAWTRHSTAALSYERYCLHMRSIVTAKM